MGVVISCFSRLGGIGIANVLFHTARAAYRGGMLDAVICYGNRQKEIPRKLVRHVRFQPAKPLSFLKARYYYTLKRMTLDGAAARYIRRRGCTIFHGWTTECRNSLKAARMAGAGTIVERPGPHPVVTRRILQEEYDRWGIPFPRAEGNGWLRKIDAGYRDETVSLEEFDLADRVVVQSEFGRESFLSRGFPGEKLVILPRGVSLGEFVPAPGGGTGPFRVLYVGMVCVRKGFLDLARAWEEASIPGAELWVVGQIHEELLPHLGRYRDRPGFRFFGHRKEGAAAFFSEASVFVLPSLVEGSAKTTYEAMAAGLPVVTTRNAGSVVRDGRDGFIVPPRDPRAIRDKLLLLRGNPDLARAMGVSARERIASFSWESYEDKVLSLYRGLSRGTGGS
ncbi:MAG TPA: glycosyltransferase family 4 protein [Candidatus Aquicultoraceae bacterium]|nr:glycosyltransferase family 4 protein [Candidatus Aquicultoraceae bacterium]